MNRTHSHTSDSEAGGSLISFVLYLAAVAAVTSMLFHYLERRWVDFRHAEQKAAEGRMEEAAALYRQAQAGGVNDVRLDLGLGISLFKVNDFEGARVAFERALQKRPDDLPTIQQLAGIYQVLQTPEKGVTMFEAFLARGKKLTPDADLHLARLYRETNRWDKAEPLYRSLPEDFPDHFAAQLELAEMLSWQRRYPEAIALLQNILNVHPDDREARMHLARVLSWANRLEEAQEQYRRLIDTP